MIYFFFFAYIDPLSDHSGHCKFSCQIFYYSVCFLSHIFWKQQLVAYSAPLGQIYVLHDNIL